MEIAILGSGADRMTAHSKITPSRHTTRVGDLAPRKSPAETARDREDAKSAARARKDLQDGTFDGVSLDELEASLRQSD
jgi:hypothetical protein